MTNNTKPPKTILRDPFHRQIISALAGNLDPHRFQRCVADLLRADFPGIAPVIGSGDEGFDAAIADGRGEPYPLVCTTSAGFSKIKANLVKSLRRARDRGWPRRIAAQAVSAALTPGQRAELTKAARQEDFELIQIFDRESIADRLYRNSKWCRELLSLSGRPRVLSTVPLVSRPLADIEPIGREQDLQRLREASGDRVLTGQPGSGKTLLLRILTREGSGLFLTGDDETEIAAELRDDKPIAVLVDDAHLHLERLDLLVRLREETSHDFSIIATSWPGDIERVADRLGGLPSGKRHQLEPLTRDEILEVYRRLGVEESDEIMRVLVDQSANKPGLAAALAHAWLAGDRMQALTGDLLCERLLAALERRTGSGRELSLTLAVLALGGESGVPLEAALSFLGASRVNLMPRLDLAAEAGIFQQGRDAERFSIVPPELRAALIKRTFFPSANSPAAGVRVPGWKDLISDPSLLHDGLVELLRAAHRGAGVPRSDLEELILRTEEASPWPRHDTWCGYSRLGPREAKWVVDRCPRDIVQIAKATLDYAAESTIDRLLERASSADGALHNQPEHPLRILHDWMRNARGVGAAELVTRRRLVIERAKRRLAEGAGRESLIHAMLLALDPSLESHSQDPGLGSTFSLYFGILPADAMASVASMWKDVRPAVEPIDPLTWWRLESILRAWAHPETAARRSLDETWKRHAREFVIAVVRDLWPAAENRPGLARALERVARWVDETPPLERDPVFELLFAERRHPRRDNAAGRAERDAAVATLAKKWSKRAPVEVAADLSRLSSEARFLAPGHEDLTRSFCLRLAEEVCDPTHWLETLVDAGMDALRIEPFLALCVRRRHETWEQWLERCLERESLRWAAIEQLLTIENPPQALLEHAIAEAGQYSQLIEMLCSQRKVPLPQLQALLSREDARVSLAAVAGEWSAEPQHGIRPEVAEHCLRAILAVDCVKLASLRQVPMLDFWLGEILARDPALATRWLIARLGPGDSGWLSIHGAVAEAIPPLSFDQRLAVFAVISGRRWDEDLVRNLVADDASLYREVLRMGHLADLHLLPLQRVPDDAWNALALTALAAGSSAASIADATLRGQHAIGSQSELAHWERYRTAFSTLATGDSLELRQVGQEGLRLIQTRVEEAQRRIRELELRGF